MKTLLPLTIIALFLSCQREESIKRYEDQWNSQERMEERNNNSSLIIESDKPTGSDGEGHVDFRYPMKRKTEEDQAEEARELEEYREEMEDDPFIDNYGNGETTNRRLYK